MDGMHANLYICQATLERPSVWMPPTYPDYISTQVKSREAASRITSLSSS